MRRFNRSPRGFTLVETLIVLPLKAGVAAKNLIMRLGHGTYAI